MRTPRVVWTVMVLLVAAIPGAIAQEDQPGDVRVETDDDRAVITFHEPNGRDDAFQVVLDTNDASLSLLLDGFDLGPEDDDNRTPLDENESRAPSGDAAFETQFHQLIEFEDEDRDGAYDDGERVVSAWALSDEGDRHSGGETNGTAAWLPLNQSDIRSEDGVPGTLVSARAFFSPASGDMIPVPLPDLVPGAEPVNATFGIDLAVFGQDVVWNGEPVGANGLGVDLIVENYPFLGQDSQLALLLGTEGEHSAEVVGASASNGSEDDDANDEADDEDGADEEPGPRDQGVVATGDIEDLDLMAHFTWADTAEVDGSDAPVRTSELDRGTDTAQDDETGHAPAIAYERGGNITHAAAFGVGFDGGLLAPGPGLLAALGVLGLTALVAARHRR